MAVYQRSSKKTCPIQENQLSSLSAVNSKRGQQLSIKNFFSVDESQPVVRSRPETPAKKVKTLDSTQYILDYGQKMYKTCTTCHMTYSVNDANDQLTHKKFHESVVKGIKLTCSVCCF